MINFSGGTYTNGVIDAMATDAVNIDDMVFSTAGGNFVESCDFSPGRASGVLSAGSTDVSVPPTAPAFSLEFSAAGGCIRTLAPGDGVVSSFPPDVRREKLSGEVQSLTGARPVNCARCTLPFPERPCPRGSSAQSPPNSERRTRCSALWKSPRSTCRRRRLGS